MDGQIGGWMDRQIDRQIDGWIDRQMDRWIDRQMDGYYKGWIDKQMHGRIQRLGMDRQMNNDLDINKLKEGQIDSMYRQTK